MKVYICGAHSSGKSTIARYISEKYKIPMITEVARQILSEKELNIDSLRSNLGVTDNYQREIFYRQIEAESSQKGSFVSDRSFDCLAYTAQHSRILNELITSNEMINYLYELKNDSYIFFVRPSKATMKEDGVRESLTWDGIIQIDSMCKFMLEMWNLKYYQINTDNMQERIRLIEAVLPNI